jgi:elongation factor P
MVLGFGDLRRGTTIELDGAPYKVEEYYQQKMQQRAPVYHIKLRHLITGQLIEKSFSGYGLKLVRATVENRACQYLYEDGEHYHFMDMENFEQYAVTAEVLAGAVKFLKDNMEMELVFYKDAPIAADMPTTVDLLVTDSPPGVKGDTASGATKLVTLETSHTVLVPLFINQGDRLKIDTRTGDYVERA